MKLKLEAQAPRSGNERCDEEEAGPGPTAPPSSLSYNHPCCVRVTLTTNAAVSNKL